MRKLIKKINYAVLLAFVLSTSSFASSGGGNAITDGLQLWADLATGTLARVLGLLAVAVAGAMVAMSSELSKGGKRVVVACIGIAIMVGAGNLLDFTGITGAVI